MASNVAPESTVVRTLAAQARDAVDAAIGNRADELASYAVALDEIADGISSLDEHELEIEHQLVWWRTRIDELDREHAAAAASDPLVEREMALFRGRISGANAMLRHYQQERQALGAVLDAARARYGDLLDG